MARCSCPAGPPRRSSRAAAAAAPLAAPYRRARSRRSSARRRLGRRARLVGRPRGHDNGPRHARAGRTRLSSANVPRRAFQALGAVLRLRAPSSESWTSASPAPVGAMAAAAVADISPSVASTVTPALGLRRRSPAGIDAKIASSPRAMRRNSGDRSQHIPASTNTSISRPRPCAAAKTVGCSASVSRRCLSPPCRRQGRRDGVSCFSRATLRVTRKRPARLGRVLLSPFAREWHPHQPQRFTCEPGARRRTKRLSACARARVYRRVPQARSGGVGGRAHLGGSQPCVTLAIRVAFVVW